jgi:hypothetical protein
MGCRAPQMRQPKRGLGAQPAVAVAVAVEAVRTPATPVVARSASSVRRAGVRPVVRRTSGVRTSGVRTSGVHTTGAVRVSGRTRLRCPWPASALSEALDAGMRRCGGQPPLGAAGSTCRRGARAAWSPARAEPTRTGWSWVGVEGSHEGRGPPAPRLRPALAAWPTKGAGPVPGCRSVGWGARVGPGAHQSPEVSWVRVPAWTSRHGRHRTNTNRTTTERGHSPGPAQLRRAHRVRRGAGCGRSAAAVREERCPPAAGSALTCENSGGRDRV